MVCASYSFCLTGPWVPKDREQLLCVCICPRETLMSASSFPPPDWRPAVMLGAIDCADMANQKICSDFGIIGYPTVKVKFPLG